MVRGWSGDGQGMVRGWSGDCQGMTRLDFLNRPQATHRNVGWSGDGQGMVRGWSGRATYRNM
eukprot:1939074-Prymnesium_polylepis.1